MLPRPVAPIFPRVRSANDASVTPGTRRKRSLIASLLPPPNALIPLTRTSAATSYSILCSWLRSSVPPTVVARSPRPVTMTRSRTSQLYWSGLRAMCQRPTETHTGAYWTDALKSMKRACAGTMQKRLIVGVSAFSPVTGGSITANRATSPACAPSPSAFGPGLPALLVSQ